MNAYDYFYWFVREKNLPLRRELWIKLELADWSLDDDITLRQEDNRPYSFFDLMHLMYDIVNGLKFAKKRNICHRGFFSFFLLLFYYFIYFF